MGLGTKRLGNTALEGLLIISRQNKSHGNIYKKEKGRRQIYDGLGSRACQLMHEQDLLYQSDSQPLSCIQGSKRMFGGSSPQIRAIFETGANLSLV